MRSGLSSWAYTWNIGVSGYDNPNRPYGWRDLLDRARECGAQVLQVADNLPLENISDLERFGSEAARAGIAIEAGTRGVRPDILVRFLDATAGLGVKLVRTLLHDGDARPTIAEAFAQVRALEPELRRRGITLAIENHDFYPSASLRSLIEGIGSDHVGVCLDPVNNFALGESVDEVLDQLGALAVCLHAKDFGIRRIRSGMGFELSGRPLGSGQLDLARCLQKLPKAREMSCVVELWTPWQGDIDSTCALERRWAAESMAYLASMNRSALPEKGA